MKNLWAECVTHQVEAEFKKILDFESEETLDFDELWIFPRCWNGVDGCDIRIKAKKM